MFRNLGAGTLLPSSHELVEKFTRPVPKPWKASPKNTKIKKFHVLKIWMSSLGIDLGKPDYETLAFLKIIVFIRFFADLNQERIQKSGKGSLGRK
jgi:hypothetical protein